MAANLLIIVLAAAVALMLRPWRLIGPSGPPWPWLALMVAMPLLWTIDRRAGLPQALPLSAAPLLVLLASWPLAVLAMVPVAVAAALLADLGGAEAVHRLAWQGIVPATLALGLGAAIRRWLPKHLFIYILGRGFFATMAATLVAATLPLAFAPGPVGDLLVARVLGAFAEAFITGLITAVLVAFQPQWLITYADRLYLPPPPG